MQKLPDHITETLLAKYFTKEATKQEIEIITEWLNSDESHRDLLFKLEILWLDTGLIHMEEQKHAFVDVDQAWANISTKKQKKNLSSFYIGIAASIMMLLGVFLIFKKTDSQKITLKTSDDQENIVLSEGSNITLNKNSQLIYPETFSDENRKVYLEGEAFFEIEPNPSKPFIVDLGSAQVRVLGTSFNIKTTKNSDTIFVSVVSGKVEFSSKTEKIILLAEEKAIFYKNNDRLIKQATSSIGTSHFWKSKTLKFESNTLSEVIEALNQAYKTEIMLISPNISDCEFTSTFQNESLDEILAILTMTLRLEMKQSGNSTVISGSECDD